MSSLALIAAAVVAAYPAPSSNLPQAPIVENLPKGIPTVNPALKVREPFEITVRRRDLKPFNRILHQDILSHNGALIDDTKAPHFRTYAVHQDYLERIHLLIADKQPTQLTPDYARWARQTTLTADLTITGTPNTEVTFETKAPLVTRRPLSITIMTISGILTLSLFSAVGAVAAISAHTNVPPHKHERR